MPIFPFGEGREAMPLDVSMAARRAAYDEASRTNRSNHGMHRAAKTTERYTAVRARQSARPATPRKGRQPIQMIHEIVQPTTGRVCISRGLIERDHHELDNDGKCVFCDWVKED